ncbi:cupin domain-containing protein [Thiocapsa sp.]|uniref:cupin domain-containing protein n=1 Tax=Thiocapsa sp. TaxID=2024551 RepID=UPI0034358079
MCIPKSSTPDSFVIGPALADGQQEQFPIPGDTFHTARLLGGGRWFLGGSTEWPGVIPSDVEIGDVEELARRYPDAAVMRIAGQKHVRVIEGLVGRHPHLHAANDACCSRRGFAHRQLTPPHPRRLAARPLAWLPG